MQKDEYAKRGIRLAVTVQLDVPNADNLTPVRSVGLRSRRQWSPEEGTPSCPAFSRCSRSRRQKNMRGGKKESPSASLSEED